jgi:hypothetical protein
MASPPAVILAPHGYARIDVAALIEDHGRPGVWWRFFDPGYAAPCNYNLPGACAVCGCNLPGEPACDF